MNYKLSIQRDLNRRRRALDAIRIGLIETDEAPHGLRQDGATWNNRISYLGVFTTRRQALAELLDYIDRQCLIVAEPRQNGDEGMRLRACSQGDKVRGELVASLTANGAWFGNEARP